MISFCPSPTLLYPINVKGCTSCSRGIYVWMCVLVLGECLEACVFCKKFFFCKSTPCVSHAYLCLCMDACSVCVYVCMSVCMLVYVHMVCIKIYTWPTFYILLFRFIFLWVFASSSFLFYLLCVSSARLFIVSLLLLLVLLLLFLHQETWRKSLSWVLLFPDYSLLLSFCVCVYVCKLEHVVTNLSVSQLVCMSVEKPFKACYCCFIFFLCCFFSHASVSILAFGWYQMREYFCCCCCFYEFVIYK